MCRLAVNNEINVTYVIGQKCFQMPGNLAVIHVDYIWYRLAFRERIVPRRSRWNFSGPIS